MTPQEYGALCAIHAQGVIDGKPTTEYFNDGEYTPLTGDNVFYFRNAIKYQWQAIDPLREFKEAFAEGKRVQRKYDDGVICSDWNDVASDTDWLNGQYEYRIVEPKTVKLYPFAVKHESGVWSLMNDFYASIEDAKAHTFGSLVAPINPDGSIEVEV